LPSAYNLRYHYQAQDQGQAMKIAIPLLATLTLAGCAANRPICVPEDPAYVAAHRRCLAAAPELRRFLLDGYDLRRCNEEAAAMGLYARNDRACNDPRLHADIIRQSGR
jgi:hypothetical protein